MAVFRRLVLLAYASAFGVGTFTHWQDILSKGWITCQECSAASNLYWLALAFLDPLAILLLLLRRAWGIRAMQIIMVSDVAVNLAVGISEYPVYGRWTMPGLYFQAPFMVFLFATAPFVLGKPQVADASGTPRDKSRERDLPGIGIPADDPRRKPSR